MTVMCVGMYDWMDECICEARNMAAKGKYL